MSAMPHDPARLRREAQVMRLREALDDAGNTSEANHQRAVWMAERVEALEVEVEELAGRCAADTAEVAWLRQRAETLACVEAGGWWRLRGRLLPVIRVGSRLLRRGSR
jgi:hypothetical protein